MYDKKKYIKIKIKPKQQPNLKKNEEKKYLSN